MANLKEIRNRIASINSTMQITSAMKMVSAAKSKKAQEAITAMKPYANKLSEILKGLGDNLSQTNPYLPRKNGKGGVLIVAIASDRGLCGAFNSNIIKQTLVTAERFSNQKVSIWTVGKKVNDILKKTGKVEQYCEHVFDNLTFARSKEIANALMDGYLLEKYERIILVYNTFKNVATQIVLEENFLPIEPMAEGEGQNTDYIFEPSQKEIADELVPKSLELQFYKALRDSFAAEHGARMTAMHKATDNATALRDELKLTYNKARQAAITNEILEIVSGADALGK